MGRRPGTEMDLSAIDRMGLRTVRRRCPRS